MRSCNGSRFVSGSVVAALVLAGAMAAQERPPAAKPAEPASPPRPANANELFAALAKIDGLEARFVEEKHLQLLAVPLQSRGRLYYMRPGYLARVVEEPERSAVTITPNELRMKGREGVETIDLRQSENVRLFVTSLVRVFSGDADALERSYDVHFTPDADDAKKWSLRLTPRGEPLDRILRDLTLYGDGYAVVRIEVREPNGDRTTTELESADPDRTFSAEEKAALFGIEPR